MLIVALVGLSIGYARRKAGYARRKVGNAHEVFRVHTRRLRDP
jgi:hypothetical protein